MDRQEFGLELERAKKYPSFSEHIVIGALIDAVQGLLLDAMLKGDGAMDSDTEIVKELPDRTVAVLNEGNTAIVVDDSCYVIRNWNGKEWGWSRWIFVEALEALKMLPDNPNDAERIDSVPAHQCGAICNQCGHEGICNQCGAGSKSSD